MQPVGWVMGGGGGDHYTQVFIFRSPQLLGPERLTTMHRFSHFLAVKFTVRSEPFKLMVGFSHRNEQTMLPTHGI